MATRLPKHVKELPSLEPESEDELQTPAKNQTSNLAGKLDVFGNLRIPRKVAELSPLEPDSEDEIKSDRLNCAILNESFILSPTKSIEGETPLNKLKGLENPKIAASLLTQNAATKVTSASTRDDSFEKHFKELNSDEKENSPEIIKKPQSKCRQALFTSSTQAFKDKELPQQSLLLFSRKKHTQYPYNRNDEGPPPCIEDPPVHKPLSQLDKVEERAEVAPLIDPTPIEDVSLKTSNKQTSKPTGSELLSEPSAPSKDLATPFKTTEHNFVTPQVKYQMVVSKRPNFSASTTQKSRSSLENEFRSQKILFRTPIAMSRPPALVNNSINLSFSDTIKEKDVSPKQMKLSPIKETSSKKFSEDTSKNEIAMKSDEAKVQDKPAGGGGRKTLTINGREYVLLKKLGSGGSSSVFLAKRSDNQIECALKIVDLRGDQSVVEGYLNETRLLAKLQGNINVVSLYEYQHLPSESALYMVMEKGDSDLNKILKSYKTDLPLYVLTSFWYQMLQCVGYIHENGVIHSDLKPANFLMINGRLKLIDFGIASNISVDSTSIIKFSQAGTFNYISPEALIDTSTGNSPSGKNRPKIKISMKSDVWSLGCILYLLLYKKTPFGHINNIYAKVNAISSPSTKIDYPELSIYYPAIFVEMAKKCLQHDPKKRSSVFDLLKYPFDMLIPMSTNPPNDRVFT